MKKSTLIYSKETADILIKEINRHSIKEAKGEGTFEVIATTEGIDRDGESILVKGWVLDNFMKNPVLLWGHDYYSLPIGAVTSVTQEGDSLIAKGVFANNPRAQEIRQLYDDGILKAVSVGFIPLERQANVITKAELLELSFVPVPCNPSALSTAKAAQLEKLVTTIKSAPTKQELDVKMAELLSPESKLSEEEKKSAYADLAAQYELLNEKAPEYKSYTQYELDQLFPELAEKAVKSGNVSEALDMLLQLKDDLDARITGTIDAVAEMLGESAGDDSEEDAPAEGEPEKSIKAGRVLSEKNKVTVENAVKSLKDTIKVLADLLALAETDKSSEARKAQLSLQSADKLIEAALKSLKKI